MNFNQLINAINTLSKNNKQLRQSLSAQSKTHKLYHKCIVQDQKEDRRVFGRTHKDTIRKFKELKQKTQESFFFTEIQQTKEKEIKEKKVIVRHNSADVQTKNERKLKKRNQCNSIGFILNADTVYDSFQQYAVKEDEITFSGKRSVQRKNKHLKRASLAKYRDSFKKDFLKNVQISKKILSKKKHIINKTLKFEACPSHSSCMENNFFTLTQEEEKKQILHSIQGNAYIETIMLLNQSLLCAKFDEKENHKVRIKQSAQRWRNILRKVGYNVDIFAINTNNMLLFQLDPLQQNLYNSLQELLKDQKIWHICFLFDKSLIYQEFITSASWNMSNLLYSLQFLKYLFKRFVCLEESYLQRRVEEIQSIDQAFRSMLLLIVDFQNLPKNFQNFLNDIKQKKCIFYCLKRNQQTTKTIQKCIWDALRHLEFWKKQKNELSIKSELSIKEEKKKMQQINSEGKELKKKGKLRLKIKKNKNKTQCDFKEMLNFYICSSYLSKSNHLLTNILMNQKI